MQIFTGTPLADNQVQVIVNVNGKVADMSIFETPPPLHRGPILWSKNPVSLPLCTKSTVAAVRWLAGVRVQSNRCSHYSLDSLQADEFS